MKNKRSLIFVRCLLLLLICVQLYMIFGFSAENAEESTDTSEQITEEIAKVVVENYENLPEDEQNEVIHRIDPPVRKLAHATEFGILGGLFYLFLLTFSMPLWLSPVIALLASALSGAIDEWHQTFVSGRSGQVRDVLIDSGGALLVILVLLLIYLLVRNSQKRIAVTKHTIVSPASANIAIVSDLHGEMHEQVLALLKEASPDLILIPGDLTDRENLDDSADASFAFLHDAAMIAPTYYALGNHEVGCYRKGFRKSHDPLPLSDIAKESLAKTGIFLLDNTFSTEKGISICGLSSNGGKQELALPNDLLDRFSSAPGYKILLCHHPDQALGLLSAYPDIDLAISGHAHGGQWRFFGHAIYAPDQGLFPKYTSGFYCNNRLLVSRGLGDCTIIPRICNRRELILLELKPE